MCHRPWWGRGKPRRSATLCNRPWGVQRGAATDPGQGGRWHEVTSVLERRPEGLAAGAGSRAEAAQDRARRPGGRGGEVAGREKGGRAGRREASGPVQPAAASRARAGSATGRACRQGLRDSGAGEPAGNRGANRPIRQESQRRRGEEGHRRCRRARAGRTRRRPPQQAGSQGTSEPGTEGASNVLRWEGQEAWQRRSAEVPGATRG